MNAALLSEGTGRVQVTLSAQFIGDDLVVLLFNERGHIGAVAMADYSHAERRASTSVLTRLGHREDSVACNAAYKLCKQLRRPVCAVAGIHLDGITGEEIAEISSNCDTLVERLGRQLSAGSS